MIDEERWRQAKDRFPIGSMVKVIIERPMPFGMFVRLPDLADVSAVIDAISYRPGGKDVFDHSHWPPEGTRIEAVVADHVDHGRQIRLRVGPPVWERSD